MAASGDNIAALVVRYLEHAATYYRLRGGAPSGEATNMLHALRPLVAVHGGDVLDQLAAADFRALRDGMAAELARTTVNARMQRVRRFIRWAVGRDLATPAVLGRAAAIEPLLAGRSAAREPDAVLPVPASLVAPVVRRLPPRLGCAVLLQWWTGMRVGEVLQLRAERIDRSRPTWVYLPAHHKSLHHGHARVIPFGPRARRVLGRLDGPGDLIRSRHGSAYTRRSYRLAVVRLCDALGIERWSPGRLRHSAGTRFRCAAGLESARALLGHRSCDVTEIYAERDARQAMELAERLG